MVKLVGNDSALNDTNYDTVQNPLKPKGYSFTAIEDGTPETIHYMATETKNGVRLMVYRVSDGALIGYTDLFNVTQTGWISAALIQANADIVQGTDYRLYWYGDDYIPCGTDNSGSTTVRYFDSALADDTVSSIPDPEPVLAGVTVSGIPGIYIEGTSGTSPGLRHTLKDTDTGNAQANLTGLQVMAFKSVPANPTYQATDGTTDGSGVYELNEPSINLNSITGEGLGTTDANGDLTATLGAVSETLFDKAEAGAFTVTIDTETIVDDGSGNLHLDGDDTATRGTIDYSTGDVSISGSIADSAASTDYDWRQTEIFLVMTDSAGENVAAAWMSVVDLNTANESVIRTGA